MQNKKQIDSKLGYTEQRILWNREGWCAREQCRSKHTNRLNSGNNLRYCDWCAERINEYNPGLVGEKIE